MHAHTHTIDRLPPGVASTAIHEVDHIFDAVTVSVVQRVVGMQGVALKTLIGLLLRLKTCWFYK